MKRRPKPKIGDVFEVSTPAGFAYFQFTHVGSHEVPLIRVLPGLYSSRPDITTIVNQREMYFTFYPLTYTAKSGEVTLDGNYPVPPWSKDFPIMRKHWGADEVSSWLIGPGSTPHTIEGILSLRKVRKLTPEERKLSIDSIWPHGYLVKNLLRGWTPERAEELDRQAREQQEAFAKPSLEQPQPQRMEYFLYFPRKRDASTAAARLRAKYSWETIVRKGADQKNWLTFAIADIPADEDQIDEIREYLEGLADELGGEYDGWAMKTASPETT